MGKWTSQVQHRCRDALGPWTGRDVGNEDLGLQPRAALVMLLQCGSFCTPLVWMSFELLPKPSCSLILCRVPEEEINHMKRELEKYGLQLPAFSKIGGILANELSVDEAAGDGCPQASNQGPANTGVP